MGYHTKVFNNFLEAVEFAQGKCPKPVNYYIYHSEVDDLVKAAKYKAHEYSFHNGLEIIASKPIGRRPGEIVIQPK